MAVMAVLSTSNTDMCSAVAVLRGLLEKIEDLVGSKFLALEY